MLRIADEPRLLIARVADGDTAAFAKLVGLLHPPMLRLAMRIALDDGEDALQSAFTRLWTHAASFDGERGSVEGWFRRILVNQCLDRRRAFRVVAPLEAAHELASDHPDPFEASGELIAFSGGVAGSQAACVTCHGTRGQGSRLRSAGP